MRYSDQKIQEIAQSWQHMLDVSLIWFDPAECFRRSTSKIVNKALFDLVGQSAIRVSQEKASEIREEFREIYSRLLKEEEFSDLISRAVDHTKRTKKRFELWQKNFESLLS